MSDQNPDTIRHGRMFELLRQTNHATQIMKRIDEPPMRDNDAGLAAIRRAATRSLRPRSKDVSRTQPQKPTTLDLSLFRLFPT